MTVSASRVDSLPEHAHASPAPPTSCRRSKSFASLAYAAGESPPWAYPTPPPGYKPSPDDGAPRHVPQSNQTYSTPQVRDLFLAPDWHPKSHPKMPPIVAIGRTIDGSFPIAETTAWANSNQLTAPWLVM